MSISARSPSSSHPAPLVAAVVVNWNGLEDTFACIRSLFGQTHANLEVHVVDNGSVGDDADQLFDTFGNSIRLYRNSRNEGFTGGCNTALTTILDERRADFAALLNNDAEAEPGWIAALLAAAHEHPDAGHFASRMVFHDRPSVIENAGVAILSNGDAVPRGRGRPSSTFAHPADVLGACGGAAMYRVDMLREIGLFADEFFANFEDVDLSLRAVARGWRCRYVPGAIVRHRLSRTIAKVRDDAFHARSLRNLYVATWVNLPWQVLLLDLPWIVLRDVAITVLAPLFRQSRVARISRAARRAAWSDRALVRARRASLRPLRRGSWLRIWWMQGSFVPAYWRFFVDAIVMRRRGFLE